MPAIFLHGVPDTVHVWDDLLKRLHRSDATALALPGFDSPLPEGFHATKEDYVRWIIERLDELPEPVDLFGHDWGCLLTVRVASLRPDLVRTWAGGDGPIDAKYEWHPLAKIWQTPLEGEAWMATLEPKQVRPNLERQGMPSEYAKQALDRMDFRMRDSILRLYRSAVKVGSEWEPALANVRSPGLVLWGEDDQACPVSFADRLAEKTRARRVLKFKAGHWFFLQKPDETAEALLEHWQNG